MNTRRRLAARGAASPANPARITHFLALRILALRFWKAASKTEITEIQQAAHAAAQRAAERFRSGVSQPLAAVPRWVRAGRAGSAGRIAAKPQQRLGKRSRGGRPQPRQRGGQALSRCAYLLRKLLHDSWLRCILGDRHDGARFPEARPRAVRPGPVAAVGNRNQSAVRSQSDRKRRADSVVPAAPKLSW